VRFVPADIGRAVPRTASGLPVDMAQRSWGADRYLPALGLSESAQTGRHTSRPFIAYGRRYPGVQLKNGVAQLDPRWEIYPSPASFAPYWQQTARVNPPTFLRGGGSPHPPQGPYQVAQMIAPTGGANIARTDFGAFTTAG